MAAPIVGVLGTQSLPAATTPTDLYTVPSSRRARVVIFWTNQDTTTADEITVWIRVNGAAAANSQKIYQEEDIAAETAGRSHTILLLKNTLHHQKRFGHQ